MLVLIVQHVSGEARLARFSSGVVCVSNVVSVSRWSPAVQNDRRDLIGHTLTLGDDLGILCAPVRLV